MLAPRDDFVHDHYYSDSFWWSPAGYVAKWVIVGTIFFFLLTWIVGGYLHARHRVRKGLPPLRYHRWLLSRSQRARFDPGPGAYYHAQPYGWSYRMDGRHVEPPPVYSNDLPPTYQPPAGASKINPNQNIPQRTTMSPPPPPAPTNNGGPSQGSNAAAP
ncbi:hypothetical protein P152DRAFT_397807 [Eremomyces bilateralis CBS 781.70]|uniref:Ubiquitin-protein ligase sel1 n=1 Tax=Eremomyces bilateralis CBS 781.70 TaxID=1392243 RepID=A0A6G1G2P0_9PEZI|nr:uncharacterized protein P152DRAFT_397807 [Eremomyces bilateralis CBS 781.70]KAF1812324.1 hypothetical protein P152DRAFT_397807 [Eremomyces bilateralis CBS 781.70]